MLQLILLIIMLVLMVLSILLAPKPKFENARPAAEFTLASRLTKP